MLVAVGQHMAQKPLDPLTLPMAWIGLLPVACRLSRKNILIKFGILGRQHLQIRGHSVFRPGDAIGRTFQSCEFHKTAGEVLVLSKFVLVPSPQQTTAVTASFGRQLGIRVAMDPLIIAQFGPKRWFCFRQAKRAAKIWYFGFVVVTQYATW